MIASNLFSGLPSQHAPARVGGTAPKPKVAPVKYLGGNCTAACMFALGPDCDCYCYGANHQAGFRCEGFKQEPLI